MTLLSAAREYLKAGFSVIPVKGKDKVPLIKWTEYQKRPPTKDEIESWFRDHDDDRNIGIVTGAISSLSVIDIDSDEGEKQFDEIASDTFMSPTVKTPRGGKHYYCLYHDGIGNNVGAIKGIDLRSEGGFIVAPPSIGKDGKPYEWAAGMDLSVSIPRLPEGYIKLITDTVYAPALRKHIPEPGKAFELGRRNEDLFHYCFYLAKAGATEDEVAGLASWVGSKAGMSGGEISHTVKSAIERARRGERNLAQEVRSFVDVSTGEFIISDLYRELNLVSKDEKGAVRVALHTLVEKKVLEKDSKRDGKYRKVEHDCSPIDWKNAPDTEVPLDWPFKIQELVRVFPRSIVVIAGRSNYGKTAYLLDFVRRNMGAYDIHYFNSEMGPQEVRSRISQYGLPDESWNFKMYERSENFADVVVPDSINVIDYLENLDGEEYKVKAYISRIFQKLGNGIAVIAIQKNKDVSWGRGGQATMDRARLYLTIDDGLITIVKAKNWNGMRNPNGLVHGFTMDRGIFMPSPSGWTQPDTQSVGWFPPSPTVKKPAVKKLFK